MDIYLAANYTRKDEMRGCRDIIEALGHKVTSRWIDIPNEVESAGIEGVTISESNRDQFAQYANCDWNDINDSNLVVIFTTGALSRGGRHTEFGLALAWGKKVVIVGPREHVFHCLPEVRHYPTWSAFVIEFSKGWNA